jgi:hypothetical protein
METVEQFVYDVLSRCVGRDAALTSSDLARRSGISSRSCRRIIRANYEAWGSLGVLVCEPGHGFYFATEAEQVAQERLRKVRLENEARSRREILDRVLGRNGFGALCREA